MTAIASTSKISILSNFFQNRHNCFRHFYNLKKVRRFVTLNGKYGLHRLDKCPTKGRDSHRYTAVELQATQEFMNGWFNHDFALGDHIIRAVCNLLHVRFLINVHN